MWGLLDYMSILHLPPAEGLLFKGRGEESGI